MRAQVPRPVGRKDLVLTPRQAAREALDKLDLDQALDAQFWDYLVMAAHSLVNVEPTQGHGDLGLTPA